MEDAARKWMGLMPAFTNFIPPHQTIESFLMEISVASTARGLLLKRETSCPFYQCLPYSSQEITVPPGFFHSKRRNHNISALVQSFLNDCRQFFDINQVLPENAVVPIGGFHHHIIADSVRARILDQPAGFVAISPENNIFWSSSRLPTPRCWQIYNIRIRKPYFDSSQSSISFSISQGTIF